VDSTNRSNKRRSAIDGGATQLHLPILSDALKECENLRAELNQFLEACNRLGPNPCSLGKRLAELGRQTEWGFFDGPPDGYGEVLGQEGLSAFLSNTS